MEIAAEQSLPFQFRGCSYEECGALQGACSGGSCGLMVMTGIRLAAQATLTPWHAVLIIVGTLVLALTKNKPVWIIAVAAVLGLVLR